MSPLGMSPVSGTGSERAKVARVAERTPPLARVPCRWQLVPAQRDALYNGSTVRPESCTVPAGGSPVRVSAGAPGSRHQPAGETPGAKRCVEGLEVGGSKEAGRNHVNAAASSHYQPKGVWEGRAGHVAAQAMDSVLVPDRALGPPGVRAAGRFG